MITNFLIFINEAIEKKIILYRGDSTYIDKFNYEKFEDTAIYGLGLYLTDNKRVAYTYTLKGDNSSIVTEIFPSSEKQKDAELCFVIEKLLNQVNETNIPDEELYDIFNTLKVYEYGYGKDMIERYKHGDKLFWMDKEKADKMSFEERKESIKEYDFLISNIKNNIKKLEEVHKRYDVLINKTLTYYETVKKQFDFLYDGGEGWKVIHKEKNVGHVSEFLVDQAVIEKCYIANIPMTDEIISILRRTINRYIKSEKIAEYLKNYYFFVDRFNFKYFMTNISDYHNKDNITLSNFLYDNSVFRNRDTHFETNDWNYFKSEMKKLGYKGIIYDGGEHLNSPIKHKAYVIWDLNDVERVK
jgi:hypothetical protein